MANTINDLYLKYVNKVGKTLEKDRYFQYLFEMVQAGSNVLQQKNRVLHKVVDERWLSTIEESLDAINNIIEKPRRFVTTSEEVVPVALAKKITADSVRHLSMNTQFIASNENNEVQPTRILNVTTEESYDLYENRFIYHLIQRLVTFIDKRTDVIFWSTGDEIDNTISYESKVDDAYEEINYKIEMTIKNRQSFAENDSDNMQVFMRIDRVRRMVMALRQSSFCSLMSGCAKVRSPIQRTNLMMKDPNYRTCYKLWQFLESYDEVGYTIEVKDTPLEFDEEYLFQLYTNLITNYTVFKSILEETPRQIEETAPRRRKVIKPKFIKKIEEEIVDDYNIEEVEVRKVIIEEVTQAQLDAEAKLEEESKARKTAEEALEEMDSQMIALQQQVFSLMEMNSQAEEQAELERMEKEQIIQNAEEELEQARRKSEQDLKEAREETEDIRRQKEDALTEARTQQKAREEAESLAEAERSSRIAAEEQAAAELARMKEAAAAELHAAKETAAAELHEAKETASAELHEAKEAAAAELAQTREAAKAEVIRIKEAADAELAKERDASAKELHREKEASDAKISKTQKETEAAIARTREETEAEIARIRAEAEAQMKRVRDEAKKQIEDARAHAAAEVKAATDEANEQRRIAEKETKAREKAEAKAEGNSLSRYIITALNNRKQKSEENDEEHEDVS